MEAAEGDEKKECVTSARQMILGGSSQQNHFLEVYSVNTQQIFYFLVISRERGSFFLSRVLLLMQ